MSKKNHRTVWSSSQGDLRQQKHTITSTNSLPPNRQTLYLHRESKGRKGKGVSLVKNLMLNEKDMKVLAKKLKQGCGSGGTIKNGIIEIQGDHRDKMAELLEKLGYKIKIAGG
ncbi:MAG: stress response translation initiation inhibitor YciH [Anaerolineae bacterium]|jgi:translation initiation factor 1|nr:stress response translation initiation inhibitor YciH [Anaerolineae bacterium]MBT7073838.1 stress response translation initiation inhibitor YciH [Anaerolineae bacterium]MBT7782823.1 stress response translation initiation inhibitor YciH [Anaerolineae bacterium]